MPTDALGIVMKHVTSKEPPVQRFMLANVPANGLLIFIRRTMNIAAVMRMIHEEGA
jgi:hypothetical protein